MRTYDSSPIQHSTAGFDRLLDVAETAQRAGEDILGMGAAAVASNPALPGSRLLVVIDDVLEALSALDCHPKGPAGRQARTSEIGRAGWLGNAAG